ncbi:MAG: NCS2 family permease [Candidatus Aureabacteria bacterium]|nr:NCS2 family permease [Candidatus Auribacterota bacterium]
MNHFLEKKFNLNSHDSDAKTEIRAGVVTFLTMAYIIVVNPSILEAAGIPKGPSMVATILTVIFGTLIMAFYANRPFAIAPLMGENAFVAFTVCKVLHYSWQTALAAVFVSGFFVTLLTVTRLRQWLVDSIPSGIKYAIAVGIGLFLSFIGLNESGIVALGVPGAPVHVGKITSPSVLLSIFCFLLIVVLVVRKVKGAILIGILATTFLSFVFKLTPVPEKVISLPPSLSPVFLKLDFISLFSWQIFPVILTMFLMDFLDMMGTLIGCSAQAGFLDEKGDLKDAQKPMLADSIASVFSALAGTTTSGTYVESAAGIQEGGRTGLTALVVAVLFALSLFFAPLLTSVPPHAYGPALIIVGLFMIKPIKKIDFEDYSESIPALVIIGLMSFTYNIGVGLLAGFVVYPLVKLFSGRFKEVNSGLWVLFVLSLLFFIFYPY